MVQLSVCNVLAMPQALRATCAPGSVKQRLSWGFLFVDRLPAGPCLGWAPGGHRDVHSMAACGGVQCSSFIFLRTYGGTCRGATSNTSLLVRVRSGVRSSLTAPSILSVIFVCSLVGFRSDSIDGGPHQRRILYDKGLFQQVGANHIVSRRHDLPNLHAPLLSCSGARSLTGGNQPPCFLIRALAWSIRA